MQCFQAPTTHPFGVSPSRDSSNEFGNSAAVTGSILTGSRPAPFARTGSKSTNHDLKIARAIASNVPFIRRFNSIWSSRDPRMCAMESCSRRGATGDRQPSDGRQVESFGDGAVPVAADMDAHDRRVEPVAQEPVIQ